MKLKYLDAWNARCSELVKQYFKGLTQTGLVLPFLPELAVPAWHLFVVRIAKWQALQKHLDQRGIGSLTHYPIPAHLQQAYSELGYARGAFPLAEAMGDEVLSLPMGPQLGSTDVQSVSRIFKYL